MVSVRELVENYLKSKFIYSPDAKPHYCIKRVKLIRNKDKSITYKYGEGNPALFIAGVLITNTSVDSLDDDISEEEAKKIKEKLESWGYYS